MNALTQSPNPWVTAPSRVRWMSPSRRPTVTMGARSAGWLAVTTALGLAFMATAPRADQPKPVEPTAARAISKTENRVSGPVDLRARTGSGSRIDPMSPTSLFAAEPSAQHATFSSAPLTGPSVGSFLPHREEPVVEWTEEDFPSVTVVDGRTLLAGRTRIRLVGLDLPMPEQVCRTLDGRLELCTSRAATQLELLTRWRRVTCHYRLENAEEAIGRCRIGTSDLTERMVKSGYAWRTASPV